MNSNQKLWESRVKKWKRSGKTAREFAAEIGVNRRTLEQNSYFLRKRQGITQRPAAKKTQGQPNSPTHFVEVPAISMTADTRFEVHLNSGRKLLVPAGANKTDLRTLISLLEGN